MKAVAICGLARVVWRLCSASSWKRRTGGQSMQPLFYWPLTLGLMCFAVVTDISASDFAVKGTRNSLHGSRAGWDGAQWRESALLTQCKHPMQNVLYTPACTHTHSHTDWSHSARTLPAPDLTLLPLCALTSRLRCARRFCVNSWLEDSRLQTQII